MPAQAVFKFRVTWKLKGIPDLKRRFPDSDVTRICGQSGPRFPFPAESGNGGFPIPDSGRIGKRGFPPRESSFKVSRPLTNRESGPGEREIMIASGDFRVWFSRRPRPPGPQPATSLGDTGSRAGATGQPNSEWHPRSDSESSRTKASVP